MTLQHLHIHGVHKNRTLFSNVWLMVIESFKMMMLHFNCNPTFEMESGDCLQSTGFFKLAPFLVWRSNNDNSSFICNLGFKMERGDGEQRDCCKILASSNKPCSLFGIMMESRRRRPFITNYVSSVSCTPLFVKCKQGADNFIGVIARI